MHVVKVGNNSFPLQNLHSIDQTDNLISENPVFVYKAEISIIYFKQKRSIGLRTFILFPRRKVCLSRTNWQFFFFFDNN